MQRAINLAFAFTLIAEVSHSQDKWTADNAALAATVAKNEARIAQFNAENHINGMPEAVDYESPALSAEVAKLHAAGCYAPIDDWSELWKLSYKELQRCDDVVSPDVFYTANASAAYLLEAGYRNEIQDRNRAEEHKLWKARERRCLKTPGCMVVKLEPEPSSP